MSRGKCPELAPATLSDRGSLREALGVTGSGGSWGHSGAIIRDALRGLNNTGLWLSVSPRWHSSMFSPNHFKA